MGEIRIDVPGQESSLWPQYMSGLLQEVVRSWVDKVEKHVDAGGLRVNGDLPSTEHLRIAKDFLGGSPLPISLDDLEGWREV